MCWFSFIFLEIFFIFVLSNLYKLEILLIKLIFVVKKVLDVYLIIFVFFILVWNIGILKGLLIFVSKVVVLVFEDLIIILLLLNVL